MGFSFNINKSVSYLPFVTIFLINHTHAAGNIKAFTRDGCSLFADGLINDQELRLTCCREYDKANWQGGTWHQRLNTDRQLMYCVAELGETVIAELMLDGAHIGGSPFWPAQFRWVYDWNYLRGYSRLSDTEKQMVQKVLHKHESHHNNIVLNRLYNKNSDRLNRQYKG